MRGENKANRIKEIDLPPHKIDFPPPSQLAGGRVESLGTFQQENWFLTWLKQRKGHILQFSWLI